MPTGVAVGVDLGGTRVRLVATGSAGWSRRVETRAPSLADLPGFLRRLWRQWGLSSRRVASLVVAAKGVWTPAERRLEARRLRSLARRVKVIPDVEAAYLGALGDGPGVLILAGTGSIVLGRNRRGHWARAGGLGPLLGDEGSAFYIGRWWLLWGLRDEDQARRISRSAAAVRRIAALARVVLRRARQGDGRAGRLVRNAQEILATLACGPIEDLKLPSPVRVSWAGSLMQDQAFRAGVWRALRYYARRDYATRLNVTRPARSPVEAAHAIASRLARRLDT